MQQAAPGDHERVGPFDEIDAQGEVLFQLALQAGAEVAAGHEFPFAPGQRRSVDAEDHLQRGQIDFDAGQGALHVEVADRIADGHLFQPDHRGDVAGRGLLDLAAAEIVEDVQRDDFGGQDCAAGLHQGHGLPLADHARVDPADRNPSHVVRPVDARDQHLQRLVRPDLGAGNGRQDQVQQRLHRGAGRRRVERGVAVPRLVNTWGKSDR